MKIYTLIVLFFLSFILSAQDRNINKLSAKQQLKTARFLIKKNSHFEAIEIIKILLKSDPKNTGLISLLAQSYLQVRDYERATQLYATLIDKDGKSDAWLPYSKCLKYKGKYLDSFEAYKMYINNARKAPNMKGNVLTKFNQNYEQETKYFAKSLALSQKEPSKATIIHLGNDVNSGYSDISPCLKDSNNLIFATHQSDSVLKFGYGEAQFNQIKLMKSEKNLDDTWGKPKLIKEVNKIGYHAANGTFNADKSKFYYTLCKYDKKDRLICQIYKSKVENGKILAGKKLNGNINLPQFTSTQPSLSYTLINNEPHEVIYFSSNRNGTMGGMDIFYAISDAKDRIISVENAGININSAADEVTPFYDNVSNKLYFSSNNNSGLGGYDIYVSQGEKNQWKITRNMGLPINSSADDTYFRMEENAEKTFLVSNRPGGNSLTSETCCDDIYNAQIYNQNNLIVNVYNPKKVKINTDSLSITMISKSKEELKFQISETDSLQKQYPLKPNDELLTTLIVNNDTIKFETFTNTKSNIDTNFRFDKSKIDFVLENYPNENVQIIQLYLKEKLPKLDTLPKPALAFNDPKIEIINPKPILVEITTDKNEKIKVPIDSIPNYKNKENIEFSYYFNFGYNEKDFIKKQEHNFDFITDLLKKHPESYVLIEAHSDSVGKDNYNLLLSQSRANKIKAYMISKGVSASHIKAVGYGETKPLMPNSMPDGSDNPEGRAQNRRGVINIVKKQKQ